MYFELRNHPFTSIYKFILYVLQDAQYTSPPFSFPFSSFLLGGERGERVCSVLNLARRIPRN